MFQLANHLVGIYKTNNRTKNVALGPQLLSMFEKLEKTLRTSREQKDSLEGGKNPSQSAMPAQKEPSQVAESEQEVSSQTTVSEQKNPSQTTVPEEENSTQIIVPEQRNASQSTRASQKSSSLSTVPEERSLTENLQDSEKSRDLQGAAKKSPELADQGTKKSVTFFLSPSEDKENTFMSSSADSAFE